MGQVIWAGNYEGPFSSSSSNSSSRPAPNSILTTARDAAFILATSIYRPEPRAQRCLDRLRAGPWHRPSAPAAPAGDRHSASGSLSCGCSSTPDPPLGSWRKSSPGLTGSRDGPTAKGQVLCHWLPPLGLEQRRSEIPREIPAYNPIAHCSLLSQGLASGSCSAQLARQALSVTSGCALKPCKRHFHSAGRSIRSRSWLSSNGLAVSASDKLFSEYVSVCQLSVSTHCAAWPGSARGGPDKEVPSRGEIQPGWTTLS